MHNAANADFIYNYYHDISRIALSPSASSLSFQHNSGRIFDSPPPDGCASEKLGDQRLDRHLGKDTDLMVPTGRDTPCQCLFSSGALRQILPIVAFLGGCVFSWDRFVDIGQRRQHHRRLVAF